MSSSRGGRHPTASVSPAGVGRSERCQHAEQLPWNLKKTHTVCVTTLRTLSGMHCHHVVKYFVRMLEKTWEIFPKIDMSVGTKNAQQSYNIYIMLNLTLSVSYNEMDMAIYFHISDKVTDDLTFSRLTFCPRWSCSNVILHNSNRHIYLGSA